MFNESGYPDVTLADWQKFKYEFWPRLFDQVIDREQACLPNWFVPAARGVAIASDTLLRKTGYRHGSDRLRGWYETNPQYYARDMGGDSFLMVRESQDTGLWTVERLGELRRYVDIDDVLIFPFGWTPIFTRSYQSAVWLATYCHKKHACEGLRWLKVIPDSYRSC